MLLQAQKAFSPERSLSRLPCEALPFRAKWGAEPRGRRASNPRLRDCFGTMYWMVIVLFFSEMYYYIKNIFEFEDFFVWMVLNLMLLSQLLAMTKNRPSLLAMTKNGQNLSDDIYPPSVWRSQDSTYYPVNGYQKPNCYCVLYISDGNSTFL